MTLITEPILGLETIQRELFIIFHDQLNDLIDEVAGFMDPRDEALAAHLGQPYTPTVIEHVESENFHEGHRPSLIDAPVTKYPNLSVWSVRVTPTADSAMLDQITESRTLVYVEIMCKSQTDEGEVNRRVHRTIEAVNLCVVTNPTLNGIVNSADTEPSVTISEVFTRKERSSYGPHWFWQGARLEYAVRKETAPPSSSGSIFGAAQGGRGNVPIDYSQFIDQEG